MTTPAALRSGREHRAELLALIAATTTHLTAAWSRLATAQAALLARLGQIRVSQHNTGSIAAARLAAADFNRAVGDFERAARAVATRWTATDLPAAYRDGALRALRSLDRPLAAFIWSAHHQAAITALSARYYADLTTRITEAVRRAQAFARAARDQARTPEGVNRAQLLAAHPLDTVIYDGQARHPVRNWARAALAWQAVTAANAGALNLAHFDLAIQWMEIADGPECVMPGAQFVPHGHLEQMVRARFSGPAYRIQARTPSGADFLTVGPNHPVLTARGWVRAHLLREGDQLVYDRLTEDTAALAELHLEQVPVVEDVYAALVKTFPVSVRSATRHDLHRDGEFCQGEVDVVAVARGLLVEPDAAVGKHPSECHFVGADDVLAVVVGGRRSAPCFNADGHASYCPMGSPGTFFPALDPGVRVPQGQSLAPVSGDAHPADSRIDLRDVDAETRGDLRRLASVFQVQASYVFTREHHGPSARAELTTEPPLGVPSGLESSAALLADRDVPVQLGHRLSFAMVERISVDHYEGWVYDATTSGGTFAVNGFTVANCGWTTHDDLDRAHGTIRSIDDCALYPAAHPGCIRQLIPRPDLTGRTDLTSGDSP